MKTDASFASWEKRVLRERPDVREEYDRLAPEMAVISAIIEARKRKKQTQQSLAKQLGTKQSVISRLESGKANPSVAFLQRLAEATGTRLEIRFVG